MTKHSHTLQRSELILVMFSMVASMFLELWLRRELLLSGMESILAKHTALLATVPVFFLLAGPVLYRRRRLIIDLWHWNPLSLGMLWRGILVGIFCRVLWWVAMFLNVTLDIAQTNGGQPDLLWSVACPPAALMAISVFSMVLVTPFYEELIYRGLLFTYFARYGVFLGILVSAGIFMLFHTPATNPFVFCMGALLAIQLHISGSLWMPLATHLTFNGLIQLDWNCVSLQWNPVPEQLPMVGVSVVLALLGSLAVAGIFLLLRAAQTAKKEALTTPPMVDL